MEMAILEFWGGSMRGGAATLPMSITVYLLISARHADGTDPVRDWAGTKLLNEVLGAIDQTVTVSSDSLPGVTYVDFPIPNEPGLGGAVPLFQWVAVAPTGELAVSDVFGVMITQPWPSLDSGSEAPRSQSSRPMSSTNLVERALGKTPQPAASREKFEGFIRSRAKYALTGKKLEIWNRLSNSK